MKYTDDGRPIISISETVTAITCARMHLHRYVKKTPTAISAALPFGTAIHEVIASHGDEREIPASERLEEWFYQEWDRACGSEENEIEFPKTRDTYTIKDAVQCLINIFEHRKGMRYDGCVELAREYPFNEFPLKINHHEILVNGRIDSMWSNTDRLIVEDYKTGRAVSEEGGAKQPQMSLYYYVALAIAQREYPEHSIRECSAILYYARTGKPVPCKPVSRESLGALLGCAIEKIEAGKDVPEFGAHCSWCNYRHICN